MTTTAVVLITALAFVPAAAIPGFAQDNLLQKAAAAFSSAEALKEELNERAPAERTRAAYVRVIEAYERVYLITPHTGYADNALMAIARLYEEIGDRPAAIRTLSFLLKEYPDSPFCDDAEKDLTRLQEPPERKIQGVQNIRFWEEPNSFRVVVDVSGDVVIKQGQAKSPDRVFIDISPARLNSTTLPGRQWPIKSGLLEQIRIGQYTSNTVRLVLDVGAVGQVSSFTLRDPDRIIIDVSGAGQPSGPPVRTAAASGSRASAPVRVAENKSPPPASQDGPAGASAPPVKTAAASARRGSSPLPVRTADDRQPQVQDAPAAASSPVPSIKTAGATATRGSAQPPVRPAENKQPESLDAPAAASPPAPPVKTAAGTPPPRTAAGAARGTTPPAGRGPEGKAPQPGPQPVVTPAKPTNDGNHSMIRSLGLKLGRVVIDAGHGGHDTGSIGPSGYTEKELVLDIAQRLQKLIETQLGAKVVMTRSEDTFIPLETRTIIANDQQADLFISIHANSSLSQSVRGIETFFLNFTTSKDAMETATRENAASEKSIHDLQDLLKKIMLQDKVDESRELARHIQRSMIEKKPTEQDRGVKQAPFVVLIGANMPSILAEVCFISNPQDEKQVKNPRYRQQIAESLFQGVRSYSETLSGLKTAKTQEKN